MNLLKNFRKLKSIKNYYDYVTLVLVFFLTRVPFLGWDIVNVDAPAWNYRAKQFYAYLKNTNFAETYRSYHPGVSLMWLSGFGIELYYQIREFFYGTLPSYFDPYSFIWEHFSAKLPLVIAGAFLLVISYRILKELVGKSLAFASIFILALEPFFVANTRVLHLDGLMTLFMFNSVLFVLFYHLTKQKKIYLIFSGFFAGLAILTKVPAVFVILFNLMLFFIFRLGVVFTKRKINFKALFYTSFIFLLSSFAIFIILFPANWIDPINVITKIIINGVIETGGGAHGQYFMGEDSGDPGMIFYLYMLFFRLSPILSLFLFVGIIGFIDKLYKKEKINTKNAVFAVSILFSFFYFLQMGISTKKIDRYILPIFPFISYAGAWGLDCLSKWIKFRKFLAAILVAFLAQFFLLSKPIFPDYFVYANPLFGGIKRFYSIFGPMDWGAGYYKAAEFINSSKAKDKSKVITAAYNYASIEPYLLGNSVLIDKVDGQFKKVDFVVLPNGSSYINQAKGLNFSLDHIIKYGDFPYWFIYRNLDMSIKEFNF